jgi:hypothetical protein
MNVGLQRLLYLYFLLVSIFITYGLYHSYNKSQRDELSQINYDKELYMFRTDLLFIIRSLNTVYTAVGICRASYVDCLLARSF